MTFYLRITLLILLSTSFLACSVKQQVINDDPFSSIPPTDSDNELQIPKESVANEFINLASESAGIIRNGHLLKAAQILIQENQFSPAENQLNLMDIELITTDELIERHLLIAEIELYKGNPRKALQQLSLEPILPAAQQIRLMRIRANAFLKAGYPLESTKTRIQMDKLLVDSIDLALNHQAIWEALALLSATSLQQVSTAPMSKDLLGWVDLAIIAKRGQVDWQSLQEGIYAWQKKYPKHPAADTFIRELGNKQIELLERPEHIAVLLPLTGKYTQIASAIRDGILSSYYQHPDKTYQPIINFIDTGSTPSAIWNHYKRATNQGADFIIGPFLKSSVDILSQSSQIETPTLTLNYSSTQTETDQNFFQFGLLPEDEAYQVAEMAFRQGHTHAAILVPDSAWGERLRNAFQLQFESLGGTVVSAQTYTANKNDFKQPIQSMLNIKQSYTRYRSIQNIVRSKMKFTPYRRQDVDMIFLAATPKDARQLKPQFKFHYAGEIQVYATSHVFTGQINKQADRDIDDLNFLDMPWILNPPNKAKQALIKYWPEQQRYTRFFALGVDAYNLIPFLGRLKNKNYERFSGQTGNLYLDSFNRIHRELLSAQFIRGIPTLIDINTQPLDLVLDETQPIQ